MFNKKLFNQMKEFVGKIGGDIGEIQAEILILKEKYNSEHKRIDQISDYIQNRLVSEIQEEATEKICEASKKYIDMQLNKKLTKKKGK